MDYAVMASGLGKRYGDFVAVDGIDFRIQRGVCFGFLGPNGAGKTTTMRTGLPPENWSRCYESPQRR